MIAMRVDILTIFPKIFDSFLNEGILKIAQDKGLLEVNIYNIRDFTPNRHRQVDDYPYGGGPGMVMKPEPIFAALSSLVGERVLDIDRKKTRIVLFTPRGKRFTQKIALDFSTKDRLILICGHYEGIDERIHKLATDEISIGDYILSGGEPAALVLVDAITRLIPGVVGKRESVLKESFAEGLLEYPQYTRPLEFRGERVPEVLLSGNHKKIAEWRRREALKITLLRRPDLLKEAKLSSDDQKYLEGLKIKLRRVERSE